MCVMCLMLGMRLCRQVWSARDRQTREIVALKKVRMECEKEGVCVISKRFLICQSDELEMTGELKMLTCLESFILTSVYHL